MLKGVVFDFDGVIVDTEPLHHAAFEQAMEPEGISTPWEEYVDTYIGFDDRDAVRSMFEKAGRTVTEEQLNQLIETKARAFRDLADREGVKAYPGVLELIEALNGHVPLALCTGSLRVDIVPVLERLGLTLAFDVAVTADEVHASKPDPASYALAVERLAATFTPDITPAHCLAIEDTPYGVQSAKGAGLTVLAIDNTHHHDKLNAADHFVDSLHGLRLEDLQNMMGA